MNKDGSMRGEWLEVAITNGISKGTFYSRVYKQGWTPERAATTPVSGPHGHKTLEDGDAELMLVLREGGMSVKDIAEKFDVHRNSAYRAIKRARRLK